ncbi:hypothetical protein TIFTF001_048489 [Ficus carica]|uniref:Uncharacterized protein n=1 Tax=Ficus carica TaxID=3494 RepID=A0AA88CGS4_FICCA|nr:hypothetical protein TIFTF001_048476 [Ficus carica]GMN18623.1 hypothetical protein TIFTF001_048477 [Ficus carica]GMN18643.1 hypothetical protein TIFTF001_048488 [Ficus carica]GMN18646.1 hypothetical protein TIFTF001_048489 [Ficus carica]
MINEDDLAVSDEDEETNHNQVFWMKSKHTTARVGKQFESLEILERTLKSHKSSIEEPRALELKPLPTHLRDSGSRKKKRKKTRFTGHRLHFGGFATDFGDFAAAFLYDESVCSSKAAAKSGRTGKQSVLKCYRIATVKLQQSRAELGSNLF